MQRLNVLARGLLQNLAVVPGTIVVLYAGLAFALVEVDEHVGLESVPFVFKGDADAARTVLSVLAGSLITVAGLTFSITIVVMQLASSQFSPRVLRRLFGDRLTQVTIGSYAGIFVYSLLVLRAVGSLGDTGGFVPRLSVTVASLLGIAAVGLLIVFLHHVAESIQVSHVAADIARETLDRLEPLYPQTYGRASGDLDEDEAARLLETWRAERSGTVTAHTAGYVVSVALDDLLKGMPGGARRVTLCVRPGDFVHLDEPLAEIWPADAAGQCEEPMTAAVTIAAERDMLQDVDFGLRQLTDIAVKAMSPGINDPTTAVTCVGYLRSICTRLAERAFPDRVRRSADDATTVIVARREFDEHLEAFAEVGRHAAGDARVAATLLAALRAIADAATRAGSPERARAAIELAIGIGAQAAREARNGRDRERIEALTPEAVAAD